MKKFYMLIIALLVGLVSMGQVTATFTNASGDNKFNNSENWDTGEIPGPDDTAIIPEDMYAILDWKIEVSTLINNGTIKIVHNTKIYANTMTNNGGMACEWIELRPLDEVPEGNISFTNTGTIITAGDRDGRIEFYGASNFINSGSININLLTVYAISILNQLDGSIISDDISFHCTAMYNNGSLDVKDQLYAVSDYIYNNGNIHSENREIALWAQKDYVRNKGNGKITSTNGSVNLLGKKADFTGQVKKMNRTKTKQDEISIDFVVDTGWIVGDTAKFEGETIRFIFNYLSFLGIDSIKAIYAGSKIEFYGTAGATLDMEWNHTKDMIWVEEGSIEIHCDHINEPDEELEYLFYPDPSIGPSDTTLIGTFINSTYVADTTGGSGSFEVFFRNQSTGHREFEYTISSRLGWVTTQTGMTLNLAPFKYDSLLIDYIMPSTSDTLTDTVMVVLSIPGEYADTAYSYLRSHPLNLVGISPKHDFNFVFHVFPNPFSETIYITADIEGEVSIVDLTGRVMDKIYIKKGMCQYWQPPNELNEGLYFFRITSGNSTITKKAILNRRTK